ncbi:hypothetical protein [Pedobacter yulinensis]|uniref:hypothetical protein n=1 Tax=Pedobacter yulinensis TaxID=2126353 RepID=UPI0013A66CA0|nr:hypothetical protein [Pedobacter yulinensis]
MLITLLASDWWRYQVTEGDSSIISVKLHLKHTGLWRCIEPTGRELYTIGYREFKIRASKNHYTYQVYQ